MNKNAIAKEKLTYPKKQIAVFGSAFNPPSLGHASVLRRLTHFDKVLLVPSFSHAWNKKMSDFDLRCQWLELFLSDLAQDNLEICTIEKKIYKGQAITTWALMSSLQTLYPTDELTFVLGPDNLFNFAKFYRASDILSRWNLLACPQTLAIRSTDIRDKLDNKEDISNLTTAALAERLMKN